ncbi:MAG: type I-B CRISPR-associated endonuclease Cas1b [Candidatus Kapaibacterium sp.]
MKRNFFITTPGKLRRKENTVFFEPFAEIPEAEDENAQDQILLSIDSDNPETLPRMKRVLPIDSIGAIYIMTEATLNSRFLEFLTQKQIPLHLFNRFGYYSGSYYPREYLISGFVSVWQAAHYLDPEKRIRIARKFVEGASFNLLKNLRYYNSRGRDFTAQIDTIESLMPEIDCAQQIPNLMNTEGRIRKIYYTAFNDILQSEIKFTKREYKPPTNPINALISFCNALVYTTALSEIYRTQLDPAISFLHEPGQRRFSLALDIAEIFKPILADRIIFSLINKKELTPKHFEQKLKGHYLKENGRKIVIKKYDEKLCQTIKHRTLGREVSYRRLVRLECYKLIKHLSDEKEYQPFKIWW